MSLNILKGMKYKAGQDYFKKTVQILGGSSNGIRWCVMRWMCWKWERSPRACARLGYEFACTSEPQQWKFHEVSPVFKEDCCLTKSNYGPITILPFLSKVFGTLLCSRYPPLFWKYFFTNVFGYREKYGTDTALLNLAEQWRKELDQHNIIGIAFMDLSKAFNSLPHKLIVKKLKSYGADHRPSSWLQYSRRQRVWIGE